MNKVEFVEKIAKKTGLSKKDADACVKAFTETVTEALKEGDSVSFVGFGTFDVSARAAREGRNPKTGEKTMIPAKKAPRFKAGKLLKDALN